MEAEILPNAIRSTGGLVIVADLADALGMNRSHLMKVLKRLGYATERRRSAAFGNQLVSVLPRADAEEFLAGRSAEALGGGPDVVIR